MYFLIKLFNLAPDGICCSIEALGMWQGPRISINKTGVKISWFVLFIYFIRSFLELFNILHVTMHLEINFSLSSLVLIHLSSEKKNVARLFAACEYR